MTDAVALRADAQRNLERILEAARAVFAEQGLEASVADIAHRAGVRIALAGLRKHIAEDAGDLVERLLLRHERGRELDGQNPLGCAWQQDSRKGARRGREEASKAAYPDREEGASKAQATEEGLARQVDTSSPGRSSGAADRRPCLWHKRLPPSGTGRCVFASGILPCSVSFPITCRGKAGH